MAHDTLDDTRPHVTATCPCGGQLVAGESKTGAIVASHSAPYCERYISLEPLEYLKWARSHGALPIPTSLLRPSKRPP